MFSLKYINLTSKNKNKNDNDNDDDEVDESGCWGSLPKHKDR